MDVVGNVQVIPLSLGSSLLGPLHQEESQSVVQEILGAIGLKTECYETGFRIEGDLDAVLAAIAVIHRALHKSNVLELSVTAKLTSPLCLS